MARTSPKKYEKMLVDLCEQIQAIDKKYRDKGMYIGNLSSFIIFSEDFSETYATQKMYNIKKDMFYESIKNHVMDQMKDKPKKKKTKK